MSIIERLDRMTTKETAIVAILIPILTFIICLLISRILYAIEMQKIYNTIRINIEGERCPIIITTFDIKTIYSSGAMGKLSTQVADKSKLPTIITVDKDDYEVILGEMIPSIKKMPISDCKIFCCDSMSSLGAHRSVMILPNELSI